MFPRRTQHVFATYLAISVAFLLLGLLWLLRPSPASHAQSQPEALGSVSGTVRNAEGDPLPTITVRLEHYRNQYDPRNVTTNGTGAFQFLSVPSGIYRLYYEDKQKVYAPRYYDGTDFADDATTITVNGNDVGGITMELQAGGSISVTLQNAATYTTTGYSLRLFHQIESGGWLHYRFASPLPGEDFAHFDTLPAGNYRLCVEGRDPYSYLYDFALECFDNVLPETHEQVAPNATDIQVQASAETTVTVRLNDIPQIEGFILAPNGQPLADIKVVLTQQHLGGYPQFTATTDEAGYFSFPYVASGAYDLIFNSSYNGSNEYLSIYYPNERTYATSSNILVDTTTRISVTRRLERSSRIIGKVTLPNDVPVSWANINLFRRRGDGSWSQPGDCYELCPYYRYDANTGIYTVTNIFDGQYRVQAFYYTAGSQAYLSAFYGGDSFETADDIVITTGQTQAGIDITVGASEFESSITGHVTANGEPLAGIEVGFFTQNFYGPEAAMPLFSTMTDEQGRYQLDGLPIGYFPIGFRDPSGVYATTYYSGSSSIFGATSVVITATGVVENINAKMTPGSTIRGHVRTKNGQAAGGFIIQIVPQYHDPYSGPLLAYIDERSDANGFFEVTGLPAGIYYLRATAPFGSGEFPSFTARYHPGESDPYRAQLLVVEEDQTLVDKDIFFFFTPTNFMPRIGGAPETPQPTYTPAPTVEWVPETPFPLATPTVTPAIP